MVVLKQVFKQGFVFRQVFRQVQVFMQVLCAERPEWVCSSKYWGRTFGTQHVGRRSAGPIGKVTQCRPMLYIQGEHKSKQRHEGRAELATNTRQNQVKNEAVSNAVAQQNSDTEDSACRQPQQRASVPEVGSQQGCGHPGDVET